MCTKKLEVKSSYMYLIWPLTTFGQGRLKHYNKVILRRHILPRLQYVDMYLRLDFFIELGIQNAFPLPGWCWFTRVFTCIYCCGNIIEKVLSTLGMCIFSSKLVSVYLVVFRFFSCISIVSVEITRYNTTHQATLQYKRWSFCAQACVLFSRRPFHCQISFLVCKRRQFVQKLTMFQHTSQVSYNFNQHYISFKIITT